MANFTLRFGNEILRGRYATVQHAPTIATGAVTATPATLRDIGTDSVVISFDFSDTDQPAVSAFTVTMKVRDESSTEYTLVNGLTNGNGGLTVTDNGSGSYTASYTWTPSGGQASGLYDLYGSVTDDVGTATDGYANNTDELTLLAAFSATSTDWFEYTENFMVTFISRIKSAIDNDSTIQAAYAPDTFAMWKDDVKRFDINASLKYCLILIHDSQSDEHISAGSGRDDVVLRARVTVYTRSSKTLSSNVEINAYGDGTAARPGAYEIVEDLRELFRLNFLTSGGERYVWDLNVGTAGPSEQDDEAFTDDVVAASFELIGHKHRFYWS